VPLGMALTVALGRNDGKRSATRDGIDVALGRNDGKRSGTRDGIDSGTGKE
jgi:hypothetical protein